MCFHIFSSVCLHLCLIEIHRRDLNKIQMRFIAKCNNTGNMQIDLMMIQCILQSNESLIKPLQAIGWNHYSNGREMQEEEKQLL